MNSYICHCTVNVYDGISTLTARPTEFVEAENQAEACRKVNKRLFEQYKKLGCNDVSVTFAIVKQI